MWGEIIVSFGAVTGYLYVGFPDTDRDTYLRLKNLKDDTRGLSQKDLSTIVELSRKRMKQIGMSFVPPMIEQTVDKIEELFIGKGKKKHKLFPNR